MLRATYFAVIAASFNPRPFGSPCGLSPITHKILEIITRRFQHPSEHSLCVSSEKIKSKLIWVQKLWRSNWGHVSSIFAGKASLEKILDVVWPSCDVTGKKNKFNGTVFGASWRALSNAVWIFSIRIVFSEIWRRPFGPLLIRSCNFSDPIGARVKWYRQSKATCRKLWFYEASDM